MIVVTSRPAVCNERIAVSLPGPTPFTTTSTFLIPESNAILPAFSAANPAANGVDFLLPLKPIAPLEAQATTLPSLSVIVVIVLLKVA